MTDIVDKAVEKTIRQNTTRDGALARRMKAHCSDYNIHEYMDMLKIFKEVVEEIVLDGGRVSLENFGAFETKNVKGKYGKHFITKEWVYWPSVQRMKFVPSATMEARWRTIRKKKEAKVENNLEQS